MSFMSELDYVLRDYREKRAWLDTLGEEMSGEREMAYEALVLAADELALVLSRSLGVPGGNV